MTRQEFIVFFDGYCHLCSGTVDFFAKKDKQGVLKYSPLQGETAKQLVSSECIRDLNTVVFYKNGSLFTHSAAWIEMMKVLGGIYGIVGRAASLVPAVVRELVYNFVAKNRYKWFGKSEHCRLPKPGEEKLFLP